MGGAVAFGQLLATHGAEINQTLARASLAPIDLGRLLVNLGVHPDEMNAVLVGEMLAQGETVQEGNSGGCAASLRQPAARSETPRRPWRSRGWACRSRR